MLEGLKFKGYKSFNVDYVCIEKFEKINVFIGKNNSGKSSCLDIIENLVDADVLAENKFSKDGLEIRVVHTLNREDILHVFPENVSGGKIPAMYHSEYGMRFLGERMEFSVSSVNSAYNNVVKRF